MFKSLIVIFSVVLLASCSGSGSVDKQKVSGASTETKQEAAKISGAETTEDEKISGASTE